MRPDFLTVRTKILLVILAAFLLTGTIFFLLWKNEDRKTAMWLTENTEKSKTQFSQVIELRAQPIKFFVHDYSYWDEFVSYMKNRSADWWSLNILEGIRKYNCAAILLFDDEKNLVNAAYESGATGIERAIDLSPIRIDTPEFYHFFINFNNKLYEVFAAPVQPSSDIKRESIPRGYLMAAQEWRDEYGAELRRISQSDFILHRGDECRIPLIRKIPLRDMHGREIACVEVIPDSTLMAKLANFQKSQMLLYVGLALLYIVAVFWLSHRGLTEPLARIIACIQENNPEKLGNLRYSADELGLIARELEEFFSSRGLLEQYRSALDASNIVSKTDLEGRITYVNQEFLSVTGFTRNEVLGRKHLELLKSEISEEEFKNIGETLRAGKLWKGVLKNLRKDGSPFYINTTVAPLRSERGSVTEYVGIMTDITDAYERLKTIHHQATDLLTGLPNRQRLLQDVEMAKEPLLALINIDRFRDINESYGHETGDEMLRVFGERLLKNVCENTNVYRIYGDAFALLSSDRSRESSFINHCRTVIEDFDRSPIVFGEISYPATVRIGIASDDDVLIHSEMALTYAKEKKEDLVIFEKNIDFAEAIRNGMVWTRKIKSAIEKDHIFLYGQKIVPSSGSGEVKYECLMRLMDDDGSMISPYFFLEHAKRAKLYHRLTQKMIKRSFEYFQALPNDFSINISHEDILNATTSQLLLEMLERYGIGERLVVEILEHEGIENFQAVNHFLEKLRKYGVRIAIDDFGKGYSNFDYLIRLKVDFLKIDGSLIKNIDHDRHAFMMVETIAEFARKLGIQTVAEFVQNEDVYRTLQQLPIDFLQGYHIDEPRRLEHKG